MGKSNWSLHEESIRCISPSLEPDLILCPPTPSHRKGSPIRERLRSVYVLFKARLIVRDGGTPRLSDTATVVISVPRNNFSPRFLHGNLQVRIPFNEDIGTLVADVNATDDDGSVSTPSFAVLPFPRPLEPSSPSVFAALSFLSSRNSLQVFSFFLF